MEYEYEEVIAFELDAYLETALSRISVVKRCPGCDRRFVPAQMKVEGEFEPVCPGCGFRYVVFMHMGS